MLDVFCRAIHRGLDLAAAAYAIANEGRRLLSCDRLSVVVRKKYRFRLIAVSGLDTIDTKSDAAARLEKLAAAVAVSGEPLWHPFENDAAAPQIEQVLEPYLDSSGARTIAVVPLYETGDSDLPRCAVHALLILEQFRAAAWEPSVRQQIEILAPHAGLALENALEFEQSWPASLQRRVRGRRRAVDGRRPNRFLAVAVVVVAALAALAWIPADLYIRAEGAIVPATRRRVYAPLDGVVTEVHVDHGNVVRFGQTLLVLENSELEVQFSRVAGELETARRRMASVAAARRDGEGTTREDRQRQTQLTAEEEELREWVAGLECQYQALAAQRSQLRLTSPVAGTITSWNLRDELMARPVRRGEPLLSVMQLGGPWTLELRFHGDELRHVATAKPDGEPLRVVFSLPARPESVLRASLAELGCAIETDDDGEQWIDARALIDDTDTGALRPDAFVTAWIHCGRRAVGYVWFREVIDFLRYEVF